MWVYQDSLSSDWYDESWSKNYSLNSTDFVHSGEYLKLLFILISHSVLTEIDIQLL